MTRLEVIADRRRLAIVRALARAGTASPVELAASAGVNVNTARTHLQALEREGAVERVSGGGGKRGRPRVLFRLTDPRTPRSEDYLALSELMASCLLDAAVERRELARLAAEWGRRAGAEAGAEEGVQTLVRTMRRLGF